MPIDLTALKQLRDRTGVGMVEAKSALTEADGDIERAVLTLRKQGHKAALKKSQRVMKEGYIGMYLHSNGKVGVMVELLCETDFVARTDALRTLAKDIALHIAASHPQYVAPEDVPSEVVERERELYRAQMEGLQKSQNIQETIIEGKLAAFYNETCLLRQKFVKDETQTIQNIIHGAIQRVGENIAVGQFCRFAI